MKSPYLHTIKTQESALPLPMGEGLGWGLLEKI